jgi:NADH dehydrogenase
VHTGHPRVILVTGAGGFIGRRVVARLLDQGGRVRAMVHTWNPFEPSPSLEVIRGDVRDAAAIERAVSGVEAVVHLAAAKADEHDSEEINVGGATHLIDACRAGHCHRVINISTQSTKIARKGVYGRTKLAADELFHSSRLDVTTLLLSIVYDESRESVFGTLVTAVERLPVVPVFGDGKWLSAPLHVEDVSAAVVACLGSDQTIGRKYDLGGPHQLTFDELIDAVAQRVGRTPLVLHVPLRVSLLIARLLRLVLQRPPITISNVLGSNQNTHIDITQAHVDFGFNPREFRVSLMEILGTHEASVLSGRVLAGEARLLGGYLVGVDPAPDLVARYEAACRRLFGDETDAELLFVRRHAWALPWLDAAIGLMRPASALRQRILLMAAILEATPRHSAFFLDEPRQPLAVLAHLTFQALRSVAALAIGLPVLLFVRARQ